MKSLLLGCAILLIIGITDLPIGYYSLLRIAVTLFAIFVVLKEFENKLNFWVVMFGLIAVVFNPIIPIYLNDKSAWMIIDIIVAIIFVVKSLTLK
jgi:hypothetical protein